MVTVMLLNISVLYPVMINTNQLLAASIAAKVYHDNFIDDLVNENPELEKYNWTSNMCCDTAEHINAIKNGITPYHRKSFGPCK